MGTFFGLYIALKDFDIAHIDKSIPALLVGLKTKFLVSLWGVALSFIFKIILLIADSKNKKNIISNSTLDDVVIVLNNLNENITNGTSKQTDSLTLLRNDFSTFSRTMADQNSRAFIAALSDVIKDFNTKINEQFGENFKHLNEAVGNLLTWQDNNRIEMHNILTALTLHNKGLEIANNSIAISKSTLDQSLEKLESIKEVCEQIAPAIDKLSSHSANASESMKNMVIFSEQFRDLFPKLTINLDSMSRSANETITQFNENLKITYKMQLEQQKREYDNFLSTSSQIRQTLESSVIENAKLITSQIENISRNQGEIISDHLKAIDKGLEEELIKALEYLGGNLASLSEKFVSDYTPLTERLHQLIEVSRKVN